MRRTVRYLSMAIAGAALAVVLAACGQPVEYRTAEKSFSHQFDAEQTGSVTAGESTPYKEEAVTVPEEALRDSIQVESVTFNYEITNNTSVAIDAVGYVSSDTETDGQVGSNDEELFNQEIAAGDTISGSVESETVKQVLNDQQETFVVGGQATTASDGDIESDDSIDVTVSATIAATLSLGGM